MVLTNCYRDLRSFVRAFINAKNSKSDDEADEIQNGSKNKRSTCLPSLDCFKDAESKKEYLKHLDNIELLIKDAGDKKLPMSNERILIHYKRFWKEIISVLEHIIIGTARDPPTKNNENGLNFCGKTIFREEVREMMGLDSTGNKDSKNDMILVEESQDSLMGLDSTGKRDSKNDMIFVEESLDSSGFTWKPRKNSAKDRIEWPDFIKTEHPYSAFFVMFYMLQQQEFQDLINANDELLKQNEKLDEEDREELEHFLTLNRQNKWSDKLIEAGIFPRLFKDLTEEMLKDAGITASGDRKTILKRADSFAKKQNVLQEN